MKAEVFAASFSSCVLCWVVAMGGCNAQPPTHSANSAGEVQSSIVMEDESRHGEARSRMIERQLKAVGRDIKDERVLQAMRDVPRHRFVPKALRDQAYDDSPLPIGYQQTISQPYIVAYMTEILRLRPTDKVLEIGTGSGYQAAVLARLVKEVYSVEDRRAVGTAPENALAVAD